MEINPTKNAIRIMAAPPRSIASVAICQSIEKETKIQSDIQLTQKVLYAEYRLHQNSSRTSTTETLISENALLRASQHRVIFNTVEFYLRHSRKHYRFSVLKELEQIGC